MQTKTLSAEAMAVIDGYLHMKAGNAVASVPYFNNKTVRVKHGMRVRIGKGNPNDISEEIEAFSIKHHVSLITLSDEALKKILVDNNIGTDCSAFAYHTLEAESQKRGVGKLNKHISFVHRHGPMGKMNAFLRPVENCNVSTLAAERNSRIIDVTKVEPGDFISLLGGPMTGERDHILVIHAVDYDGDQTKKIYYSHIIAYPEDGVYGSGVKQGSIVITDPKADIIAQSWTEAQLTGEPNAIYGRAKASKTEIRRLKWFS